MLVSSSARTGALLVFARAPARCSMARSISRTARARLRQNLCLRQQQLTLGPLPAARPRTVPGLRIDS